MRLFQLSKNKKIADKDQKQAENKNNIKQNLRKKNILNFPFLSEKTVLLNNQGKYVFNVSPTVNKREIKNSVEEIYKVNVEKVNIINLPAKRKKSRRLINLKGRGSKAIISLAKGQKIDLGI